MAETTGDTTSPPPTPAEAFADEIARHVRTHRQFPAMTPQDAAREAVLVVLTDRTATRRALSILAAADDHPAPSADDDLDDTIDTHLQAALGALTETGSTRPATADPTAPRWKNEVG